MRRLLRGLWRGLAGLARAGFGAIIFVLQFIVSAGDNLMRGRERLFSTAIVWITLAAMVNGVLDRFLRVSANFTGLWPNIPFPNYAPDSAAWTDWWEGYQQAMDQAQAISGDLVQQVTANLEAQLAANMGPMVFLVIALVLAATLATLFIWKDAQREAEPALETRSDAKSKRDFRRVEQMMQNLSAEELDALRDRLLESDGEAVSMDALLRQQARR